MTHFNLKLAAFVSAFTIVATAAFAHARLDSASPAVGSTVSTSPAQVTLNFTEALEAKFSGAQIRNAAGARVDKGSSASGRSLRIGVSGLAPGTYTVQWHVLSTDTHKSEGSFNFRVGK